MQNNTESQMESKLRASIQEVYDLQLGKVNVMMEPEFVACNEFEKTLTIGFPVLEWELNRAGMMHGGIIGTTFDFTFGILSRHYATLNYSPTISLETTFLKPVPFEDTLLITAKVLSAGKTLTHLSAEGHLKSSGKLVAVAKASYMNVDTSK